MINEIIKSTPDQEIVTERIMNARQEIVFKAWTDPDHLKNWWGPNGFTNTFNEFDLQPGGKWSFVMHGPDGRDYPNESQFIKIDNPGFFAFNHISNPKFQVQATFEVVDGIKTKVVFKMIFRTKEERDNIIAFVSDKNEENMDRLEAELLKMAARI